MNRLDDIEVIYGRPLFLMAKPAGSSCNLRCSYCYYLEKSGLYQGSSQLMDEETLELFIKEYIESQTTPEVMFIWHGGEPMLRPIAFYQRAIEHNGDVYSCDHFVFPEYKLGNIYDSSLISMMYGSKQREFGESKHRSLPRQCSRCGG